jgi:c-di-GMP-binding flagellar brake protein YcgR
MFFYHLPGSSIKCFEASRLKKAGDYLGLEFPTKIYKIQRRRYGRVSTPNYSTATFTVDNKQRINYGTVENISHNGAYISCDLPSIIDEGDLINSFSMSVCLRLSREEKTILRVTEALVVRSVVFDSRTKGLGIHFDLLGEMKDLMEEYLNLRHIEDGSFQDVGHLE